MEKEQKFSLETKSSSFSTRQTQEGRHGGVVSSQNAREICDCKVNNAKETNKPRSRVWKTVMWFTRKGKNGKMDCCQCGEEVGKYEYSQRDLLECTGQVKPNGHSNSWSFTRTASRKFRISSRKRRCKSESSKTPFCGHREHALPSGSKPKSRAHGDVRCGAGSPTATGSFCDFGSNGRVGPGAARKTRQASFLTEIARELNPPAGNHPVKDVNNRRPSTDLSKSLSSNFGGCTAEGLSPLLHQSVRRCKSFPGPFSNTCAFKRRNIDQQSADACYFSPPSKQKCRGHRRTATFGGKPSAQFMSTRVKKSKSANTVDFMKLNKASSSLGEIRDQDGSIVGVVHFYKSPKSSCMRRLSSFSDGIRLRKLSMSEEFSGSVSGMENQGSTSGENERKMDLNRIDGNLDSTVSFPICVSPSQDPINRDVNGINDSVLSESNLETNLNVSHGSRAAIYPTFLCQAVEELESEQPSSALQNSQNPGDDSGISESYLEGNLSLSPVPKRCVSPTLPSRTEKELHGEQALISLLNSQNSGVDEVDDSSFSESFMGNGLKLSPIAKSSSTFPSKTMDELERNLTFDPAITEQPEECLNLTTQDISVVQDDALTDSVESFRTETEQKVATAIQDSETIKERNRRRKNNSDVYALQKSPNDTFMNELADGCLTSDDKNRNQITSKVHLDPSNDGFDPMLEGCISSDDKFNHDINIDRRINKDNRNENLNLEDGVVLSACNSGCATAQSCSNGVARLQDICENHPFKLHDSISTEGTSDDEIMSTDSSETDVITQIQQQQNLDEKVHKERQVLVNSPRYHKCDYKFTKETNKMKSRITYPCEEVVEKSIPFGSSGIAPVDGAKVPKSVAQVLENLSSSDYASCSDEEELSNSGDNPLSIWKTAEQAGLKEEDLRLPVPGETFKMRTELILRWFEEFNDEQKNIVMKKLLNRCQLPQMHLLSVAMEPNLHKSCPPNCQDMLVWLPYPVTLKILMYLDPVSLCQCNQVNKAWNELTNNPLLWQQLTRSTDHQLSEASSRKQYLKYTLPNGNIHWKKVLAERYLLQRNWLNGKYTLRTYEGHHQGIACVQFDDTRIVSGSSDKTIKLWDISNTNSELMLTLEGHSGTVRCLDLNGNRLVSGSTDCTIKVWDLSFASYWAGASCKVTMVGHLHTVRCLQADDKKLVSGSYDKTVKVWDLKTGECRLTLRGHTAAVLCVQFDDQKIVSGSYDKKIKVWDLTEGTCLMTLDGHQDAVTCLNLTHDGMKIITGSLDYSLKFWDLLTGKCYGTLDWITSEGHTAVVRCLQVDSWRIISGGDDKTLKVWELATGQRLLTLRYHSDGVTCMQFNDFAIVSGSYDRTVKLWDFTPQHPYLEMDIGATKGFCKQLREKYNNKQVGQTKRAILVDFHAFR